MLIILCELFIQISVKSYLSLSFIEWCVRKVAHEGIDFLSFSKNITSLNQTLEYNTFRSLATASFRFYPYYLNKQVHQFE